MADVYYISDHGDNNGFGGGSATIFRGGLPCTEKMHTDDARKWCDRMNAAYEAGRAVGYTEGRNAAARDLAEFLKPRMK